MISSHVWLYFAVTGGLTGMFLIAWYFTNRTMTQRVSRGAPGPDNSTQRSIGVEGEPKKFNIDPNAAEDANQLLIWPTLQVADNADHRTHAHHVQSNLNPSPHAEGQLGFELEPVSPTDDAKNGHMSSPVTSDDRHGATPYHLAGGLGVQGSRMFEKTCARCAMPI